ncbi:MAG TPA: patatin-like phospholipase family protein [Candidatus Acidoferrum sp.]|jgi:NTE family protein|nr:patatin-like phospholipase family protein [Candidatus Acidoferrum sp.]
MKALVLSGGGALGAFEAGALKALTDAGEEFDLICGTSIGAINASFAAQDKVDQLAGLWRGIASLNPPVIDYVDQVQYAIDVADELEKVERLNLAGFLPLVERWMQIGSKKAFLGLLGAIKPDAIENILSQNLNINELKRSLVVTATDLTRGSSEAFYAFRGPDGAAMQRSFTSTPGVVSHEITTSDQFALTVRASAAIPGAFVPVAMNLGTAGNKAFVDGGVANNVPVGLAADAGATDITVMMLQPPQATLPNYPTSNLIEIGMASFTVMQQTLLLQDTLSVNRNPSVRVRYVAPTAQLPVSVLGFNDQSGIDQAFAAGAEAAKKIVELAKS